MTSLLLWGLGWGWVREGLILISISLLILLQVCTRVKSFGSRYSMKLFHMLLCNLDLKVLCTIYEYIDDHPTT